MKAKIRKIIIGLKVLESIFKVKLFKPIPLFCEWEVTSHCNMMCGFCSTFINKRNYTKEISTNDAFNLIEQLSALGTRLLHFSGGEPTLREDLHELITKAKEKNMIVSLTTNGTASIKKMEKILHADLICVSIDGTEQYHDSIRKSPGSYKKAIEILQFMRSKNRKPLINTIFTPGISYKMLEELVEIARSLNLQLLLNNLGRNINQEYDINTIREKNDLSSAYFSEYISVLSSLKRKYGNTISSVEPHLTVIRQGGVNVFGCRAMDITITIKSDGSVSLPCNGWSKVLAKGYLKEIYYGKEANEIRLQQGKYPICKGCTLRCQGQAAGLLKIRGFAAIFDSYIRSLFSN